MGGLSARSIRIFAVLEAYRSGDGDILDTLLPFFEPHLADQSGSQFDPSKISDAMKSAFGWNLSSDIVEEFIPRFKARGWLSEVGSSNSKSYQITYTAAEPMAPSDLNEIVSAIGEAFKDFVENLSPLFSYNKTPEQLVEILIEWLISIDGYNESALRTEIKKVSKVRGKLTMEVAHPEGDNLHSEDRYLCARFTKHLSDIRSNLFAQLTHIASIGLITDVVQDFVKPVTAVSKTDLHLYLDAPVALDLLGVSGRSPNENVSLLIGEMQKIGAKIRIFKTSVDELQLALQTVLKRPPSERIGPTADALRRGEVLESLVRAVRDDPTHFLQQLGVDVVHRSLEQYPNSHAHFPKLLYDKFLERVTWHTEQKPRAHDATTAALIMRLRNGAATRDIFKSKHVLVSRNAHFAAMARRFCIEELDLAENVVGPVVHQRQIATAAWLRTGLGGSAELPRRYLLATCERVLGIKRNVIQVARSTAQNLSPDQAKQLELLLTQDRSAQYLMDKTLGVSDVITSNNLGMLIEGMKADLIVSETNAHRKEIQKLKDQADGAVKAQALISQKALESESEAKEELDREKIKFRSIINAAVGHANKIIRTRIMLVNGVFLALALIVGLATAFGDLSGFVKLLVVGCAAILASLFTYNQLWDRPTGIRQALESHCYKVLVDVLIERGITTTPTELRIDLVDLRFVVRDREPERGEANLLL